MSTTDNNNTFYQKAMQCGTLLGLLWITMYASCVLGLSGGNPFFIILFIALNILSPFYVGYLTTKYRRAFCDNTLTYGKALIFVFTMYVCASLLSAVAHFVYFEFLDNGLFMQMLLEMKKIMEDNPQQFKELSSEFGEAVTQLTSLGTRDIVINILLSNINNGMLLSLIIALFVKRNNS